MESILLRGKRRRKCNTRIYSIQLWYKQNKKNLLLRKSNNKYTQKIASKNVLTWHWPSRVHILSTPIAMVTELGWLALGAQCRRVFSIFSSRWNFHSPPSLRSSPRRSLRGMWCNVLPRVHSWQRPPSRWSQEAARMWHLTAALLSVRYARILADNVFSSYTVLFSSFILSNYTF